MLVLSSRALDPDHAQCSAQFGFAEVCGIHLQARDPQPAAPSSPTAEDEVWLLIKALQDVVPLWMAVKHKLQTAALLDAVCTQEVPMACVLAELEVTGM